MLEEIREGAVRLKVHKVQVTSKDMEVFYNPVMRMNRDISVLLLGSISAGKLQIADPLAGTGIRSIRFLKELASSKIKKLYINDYSLDSVNLIKKNLRLNKINFNNHRKIIVSCQDANLFLLNSTGFDYIDIDPFGTPNPYLDAACKRISRDGIIAVTATDTSALCGTFPKACMRKYWAVPKKDSIMHETGLRILIRKIQLVASQYDKALFPIFSYSNEHYMRVFLKNIKGKEYVDEILKQHDYFSNAGPLWLGKLWDENLIEKMCKNASRNNIFSNDKVLTSFLDIIREESKINSVGFYDMNYICEKYHLRNLQKKDEIITKIQKNGYMASSTHFKGEGIRSNIPLKLLLRILKS